MPEFQEELRRLRGLRTQDEFARALGVSRVSVALWEGGNAVPQLRNARKLVAAGMDPALVFKAAVAGKAKTVAA